MKEVMIATGGTGGHINPALAFAEILKKQSPDYSVSFFGSSNRMEAELIPSRGYEFYGVHMSGMNGDILAKLKSAGSLWMAEQKCIQLLKKKRPLACIGFGNYISVPLILAAHRLGIPTMIHEQNSSAGKANKMLSRYADAVVGSYEENQKDFNSSKFRLLGNPEATLAATEQMPDIFALYGLKADVPLVFFMMGSLGSESVSKVIDDVCPYICQYAQVLIASGKENGYQFHSRFDNLQIREYVNGAAALKQATVSVTRAGATTLCEITALGAASILIPSPYVPNNHQVHNAEVLVNHGAAAMIEEKDLTAERLNNEIERLVHSRNDREQMQKKAKVLGTPDAAYKMIQWMEELIANGQSGK